MLRVVLMGIVVGGIVLACALLFLRRDAPPAPSEVTPPTETVAPLSTTAAAAPQAPVTQEPALSPDDPFASATTEYREAKTALEVELEKQAGEADPELIEPVKENLGLIERAVMEVTMALAENPDSEPLRQRLLDMYDEQVQLLRKALRLTSGEQ